MNEPVAVGLDIGGTFTDVVAVRGDRLTLAKVPSTPPHYDRGFLEALEKLELDVSTIGRFVHGTTAAVNAILTASGSRTALLATAGFRDILDIRRGDRAELFNYWWKPRPPLAKRYDRFEIRERIAYDGSISTQLFESDVVRAAELIAARGIESVAICFLNSFVNDEHERAAKELIVAHLPDVYVCTSSELVPEILEYERTSTTVANAYVGPLMERYYQRMLESLDELGYENELLVMASSGDAMTLGTAKEVPIATAMSGIAAGVMAGAFIGDELGLPNLLTLDVGGTSSDLALIWNGRPRLTSEWEIDFGMPIRTRSVEVHTIGAGGGSVAWVDAGSLLHVGPQSAGADPGPAAYGRGGIVPTVTDAQLVLGRLDANLWLELYGWPLDEQAAISAIEAAVGGVLELEVLEAADAILGVMVNNLVEAIELISVKKGYDPRTCALCAFGGAGPMYAVDIARALEIPEVVIPPAPGVTSARGLLQADVAIRSQRSVLLRGTDADAGLAQLVEQIATEASSRLAAGGFPRANVLLEADARYFGQSKYLTIPLAGARMTASAIAELFENEHEREFGYVMPPDVSQVEIVNLRAIAVADEEDRRERRPTRIETGAPAAAGERSVYFEGHGHIATAVVDRGSIAAGESVEGPALLLQRDTTLVLPPEATATCDESGNLRIVV